MAHTGHAVHALSHATTLEILVAADSKMTFASPAHRAALIAETLRQIGGAVLPKQIRPPQPRAIVRNKRRYPYLKCTRKQWSAWHHAAA